MCRAAVQQAVNCARTIHARNEIFVNPDEKHAPPAVTSTHSPRHGAVGVIVVEQKLLVIRRAQGIAAPGAYCFPGGGIEPGETEPVALIRELHEELGVQVRPLRQLWRSTTAWNVHLSWWQAELPPQAEIKPNPAEVASAHWCSIVEMLALPELLSSNRDFLAALARGEFQLD